MLVISTTPSLDGKTKALILGLSEENLKRLRDDRPVQLDVGAVVPELEGWEIFLLGPEDAVRFMAHYGIEEGDSGG